MSSVGRASAFALFILGIFEKTWSCVAKIPNIYLLHHEKSVTRYLSLTIWFSMLRVWTRMETPLDVLSRAASLVHQDDEKREFFVSITDVVF